MNKSLWKRKIKYFLAPHPVLHPAGEQIYVPKPDYKIVFWLDGGFTIAGTEDTLQINFNDPDMLVLALGELSTSHVYRIPWDRLVCFELINRSEPDEEFTKRFFLN